MKPRKVGNISNIVVYVKIQSLVERKIARSLATNEIKSTMIVKKTWTTIETTESGFAFPRRIVTAIVHNGISNQNNIHSSRPRSPALFKSDRGRATSAARPGRENHANHGRCDANYFSVRSLLPRFRAYWRVDGVTVGARIKIWGGPRAIFGRCAPSPARNAAARSELRRGGARSLW